MMIDPAGRVTLAGDFGGQLRRLVSWRLVTVIGIAALGLLSNDLSGAQEDDDLPAKQGRAELARLLAKSEPIRDARATVLAFVQGRPDRIPSYQYFWSRELGWSRLEIAVLPGRAFVFLVDERLGRVFAPLGKDLVALDEEGSKRILSIAKQFSGLADVESQVTGDLYYVGTEVVDHRQCALFLCVQGGVILTKLWVGVEDGVLRKKEFLPLTYVFQDVKVNSGLDKNLFGGGHAPTNLPVVSLSELANLLRNSNGAE